MSSIHITRGDEKPDIELTLRVNNAAQSLTGAGVTLRSIAPSGTVTTRTLEIVSESAGTVKYVWTEGESASQELGTHKCYVVIEFADAKTLTFPSKGKWFDMVVHDRAAG